jgi:hypothetical protein
MAKLQKAFLTKVREVWKREFPFLELVDIDQVPKLPKGTDFGCDEYAINRGVYYFVSFHFRPKVPGDLSIAVTVSNSPDKSVLDPPLDYRPSPTNVGTYNIAAFLGLPDCRWHLTDVDGDLNRWLFPGGEPPVVLPPDPNVWKPSSYAIEFDVIADEAIQDVNDKLKRFVFPKLEIDCKN